MHLCYLPGILYRTSKLVIFKNYRCTVRPRLLSQSNGITEDGLPITIAPMTGIRSGARSIGQSGGVADDGLPITKAPTTGNLLPASPPNATECFGAINEWKPPEYDGRGQLTGASRTVPTETDQIPMLRHHRTKCNEAEVLFHNHKTFGSMRERERE